jgi:hypothetical protein
VDFDEDLIMSALNFDKAFPSAKKVVAATVISLCFPSYVFALDAIGIHAHFNHYPQSSDTYLEMIKSTGFNSFRSDLAWNSIEQKKGIFAITGAGNQKEDEAFTKGKSDYGLSALLVLAYGNNQYGNAIDYPRTPEAIKAFANYAAWVAARYKGKVKYYEVWNEWLYGTGVTAQPRTVPPAEVYFELVKATAEAVRKVDPDAILMTGSYNPNVPRDAAWFESLMKMGILNYIDGISIHPYSLKLPEDNFIAIDKLEKVASGYAKKPVPIYITEVGNSTYTGFDGITEDAAAQFVVKYTLLAKARPYIKGLWWYDLVDDGPKATEKEQRYGFITQNGQPKATALQFKKIAQIAHDYTVDNYQSSPDGKVEISLSRNGQHALMYWQQQPVQAEPQPVSVARSLKSMIKSDPSTSQGNIRMFDREFQGQVLYESTGKEPAAQDNSPVLILSDKKITPPW